MRWFFLLTRAIRFTLLFCVLTGLVYPLVTTGVAGYLFPHQAQGSLMRDTSGRVIGSSHIGQPFTAPDHFWGRLSVAGAAGTGGASNLGPSDPALLKRVQQSVTQWQQANPNQPPPPDLLTTSGSGLDPDISPAAALAQAARVSQATGIPAGQLMELVSTQVKDRWLGIFGEQRVNVLKLNQALMQLTQK